MKRIEGKISIDEGSGKLIVDAEPHVMSKVRPIFDNSVTHFMRGEYTHKPLAFVFNMANAKDVLWLMTRYNLSIDPDLLTLIKNKSDEYDRIQESVSNADKDDTYRVTPGALSLALPLRKHQIQFKNMVTAVHRTLLGDKVGLGKTPSGISLLQEPDARPAIVVVQTHLCPQWEAEIKRFLPDATTHIIRGFKNYDLPEVDVIVTSYNRLAPWQDKLLAKPGYFKTVIFDEVQELRHTTTAKRDLSFLLSEKAKYVVGLSATPIYNQGSEIWSVIDCIKPGALGSQDDFTSEWCDWSGKIREPSVLHHYLKSQGLMLRRSAKEVGLNFGNPVKHVYTIDSDIEKLKQIQDVAKTLAISVLSGNINDSDMASKELDWKLRHATGVAKARPTAEFVKMLCESGEKVLLAAWHRDCYDIYLKELAHLNPVMFTGSESPKQKEEAKKAFIDGNAQVFIISLRSGSGVDGLQHVCSKAVFGELDWSPHVMDQVIGRLDRDGQTDVVQAFFLTIPDGSDPFMAELLQGKRDQHDGLVEGMAAEAQVLDSTPGGKDRIREMAKKYLQSLGEEIPEAVEEVGLLGDVAKTLRQVRAPMNTEEEMQLGLWGVLPGLLPGAKVEREFKLSKRSRLDFLVSNDTERVAIECKITSLKRAEVYRQVRKYVEEGVTSVVIYAPWHGISSFKVDSTPVLVVDTSTQAL